MSKRRDPFSTSALWAIGTTVVISLWFGSYLFITFAFPTLGWAEKGQIGDTFGAINALFSGLAFVAVAVTIYFQSKTLHDSKRELDLHHFETKFFQLIRVHSDILDGIELPVSSRQGIAVSKGRRNFVTMYQEFRRLYEAKAAKGRNKTPIELIEASYPIFFEKHQHDLGHYFRNLYSIVAFIHSSKLPYMTRMSYMKLLRAQLSSHELLLLFYNCLWSVGARRFKPLVEEYALLEHVPKSIPKDHLSLYSDGAYIERNS